MSVLQGSSPSAEEVFSARQELALLVEAIGQLPERCRQAFALRKVYGYTQKEIALELSCCMPSASCKKRRPVRI